MVLKGVEGTNCLGCGWPGNFVAIYIGYNKGLDAVQMLRRGKNDPTVTVNSWNDAMSQGGHLVNTACGAHQGDSEFHRHQQERTDAAIQVHCVKPMPSMF